MMTADLKLTVDLDAKAVEAYLQGDSLTSDLVVGSHASLCY